jgi:DNA modification methylase
VSNINVLLGDSHQIMKSFDSNSFDGVITSPPYNLGKNPNHRRKDQKDFSFYTQYNDNLTPEEYINWSVNIFKEYSRIVKETGVVAYNLSYSSKNPILPMQLITEVDKETDLTIADILYWKKSNATPMQTSSTHLSRLIEPIYIFVNKKYPNIFTTNKRISKVNEKTGQKFYAYYDNLLEAKNNDNTPVNHSARFSKDMVKGILDIYFPENSHILDSFVGTGTTLFACNETNRKATGIEIDPLYYNYIKDNLK